MEYETNIEQRLLVGAVEIEGKWEPVFDAIGNQLNRPFPQLISPPLCYLPVY